MSVTITRGKLEVLQRHYQQLGKLSLDSNFDAEWKEEVESKSKCGSMSGEWLFTTIADYWTDLRPQLKDVTRLIAHYAHAVKIAQPCYKHQPSTASSQRRSPFSSVEIYPYP